MTPADLRALAADHAHIRHHPHEVAAALLQAADEIERMHAALADIDILAEYGGGDGTRDWVSVGCWLKPGEVLAHMTSPRSNA